MPHGGTEYDIKKVLTISSIQAGLKDNIIQDEAVLKLNMRSCKYVAHNKMIDTIKII